MIFRQFGDHKPPSEETQLTHAVEVVASIGGKALQKTITNQVKAMMGTSATDVSTDILPFSQMPSSDNTACEELVSHVPRRSVTFGWLWPEGMEMSS